MKFLLIAAAAGIAAAQTPELKEILSRVAANQAASLEQRQNWVFHQRQLLRMVRGKTIAREEYRDYTVTPQPHGVRKDLTGFDGKYEQHGKYIRYDKPGYTYKEMDIDGELMDDLSDDLTSEKGSRDGIASNLFPLTSEQQSKYRFQFMAAERYRERPVYRIRFEPRPGEEDAAWKGEALIDAAEFQPVLVTTKFARKIPMAVRVLLGTNLRGLGFSVSYQKFADGVWFPVSYGGEFHVRAVFFYRRNISISMVNNDFRRTDVASNITYKTEEK